MIRMDMRGPSRAAECLDCVVALPAAVERMRSDCDDAKFALTMADGTRAAFEALESSDQDGLLFVAAAAQDLLYRYVMQLSILDRYTRAYCSVAISCFFKQLSQHRVRTFYILDNTLREDRFQLVLELFDLSGISTVTPRRDGLTWPAIDAKLRAGINDHGHVAYVEPDASVNHLEAVARLACEIPCVATYRNLAPDDPQHEIVNLKAADVLPA
ncbi:MAG TPA: hypothetical protein VFJ87_03610 [Rhodanobacteraceae bacterium]|nr:hypothetical protein [Rhodanobacteraceae bacterium]